ncbi:hypothetical protein ABZP36_028826 [Zizania latifolia]
MVDAHGLVKFLSTVAELARGTAASTVWPVWERELLMARDQSWPGFAHHEYDKVHDTKGTIVPLDDMAHRSFFFGVLEVAVLWSHVTPSLWKHITMFKVLTGCLWKCHTVALAPAIDEEMRMIFAVNARGDEIRAGIPDGYYGNTFASPVAIATAGDLCANPMSYVVELVKKAKRVVSMEYMRSVADFMVQRGRPPVMMGKPAYGGSAQGGDIPGLASFFIPFKNAKGEDGIVVPMCLPSPAMDRFVEELAKLMRTAADAATPTWQQPGMSKMIKSAL